MLWSSLWRPLTLFQTPIFSAMAEQNMNSPTITFSTDWQILGPWQIGTRETPWGADPLELSGGFRSLEYNKTTTFPSSLAPNGTIAWTTLTGNLSTPVNPSHSADIELDISFPEINFQSLRDIYGWAAFQWQAWARGSIIIQGKDRELQTFTLHTPQILEFWVDEVHYWGGDYFSYDTAPLVLHLAPGKHRIDVRFVREVRAMGGVGEPRITTRLSLEKSGGGLQAVEKASGGGGGGGVLMSDFVLGEDHEDQDKDKGDAVLASPWASITVRNDAEEEIQVVAIEISPKDSCVGKLEQEELKVVPGQTRPVVFRISCTYFPRNPQEMEFMILYRTKGEGELIHQTSLSHNPQISNWREPHKVTFLHPAGVVSYAILRPPSVAASSSKHISKKNLPILLSLHGAGVEAESTSARNEFQPLPDLAAWILFPTGGTPWSGDDWHVWGFADVESAVSMIPDWIENVGWKGPGVEVEKWLVVGHSNGGQGVWYTLTHHPDKVIAAAVLSGYSSIQNYVPYTLWRNAQPGRTAMAQAALGSYKHEELLANAKGVDVIIQHGREDDNVPVYHSRLMHQLLAEAGVEGSQYVEVPGQGHYWNGVYTTEPLREFYQKYLDEKNVEDDDPWKLKEWSLVTYNPGDTSSKQGVRILQLEIPGRRGRMDVHFDPTTQECVLRTKNVRQFSLPWYFEHCDMLSIDEQQISLPVEGSSSSRTTTVLTHEAGIWKVMDENIGQATLPSSPRRTGRQLGAMDAILRTKGPFLIVPHSTSATDDDASTTEQRIALQISRNLAQYFSADTSLTCPSYEEALNLPGNIISLAIGSSLPSPQNNKSFFPIQISANQRITIHTRDSHPKTYHSTEENGGLGALFLRPLSLGKLELVVWASNAEMLGKAARLVPMMTGSGQADFIIVDRTMGWKGIDGVLGMGFLDGGWEVGEGSFLI